MLTVCLHKLSAKDSFANAARKVERCINIGLRRVGNRPGEGPKWPPGGLLGDRWAVKAARNPNLGGSWVRLGRSWRLLGRSGGFPGRSWPLLGSILASRRSPF